MSNATQTTAQTATAQQGNNYVNMHTTGLGYLSRVREVPVRKGRPFWSASIAGFHGEKDDQENLNYVPFDVKAASEQALEVLKQFETQANDRDAKVLVRFKIGDQYIDTYQITKGQRTGETGFVLKGRLLFVSHVWVKTNEADGYRLAYKYETPETATTQDAPKDGTNG